VQEVNKIDTRAVSASQGLRVPFTPCPGDSCYEQQGTFTGWSREGYWLNGRLLNRHEYSQYAGPINALHLASMVSRSLPAANADRKARRAAWKEQAKHAAISAQEATSALESHLGYAIPTLDEAML